ncbi:MAG: glycosyltransferase family 2 protein, partial [Fusobacteriaceae bacterium]
MKITASIVTYNNSFEDLKAAINSFLNTELDVKLYISDNSETDKIKKLCTDSRIEYIFNNCNKGFG